jgi:Lrp/AsnC family transcriptional regulator, leucine-responsive regulatory protein
MAAIVRGIEPSWSKRRKRVGPDTQDSQAFGALAYDPCVDLDEIDHQLVRCLRANARATLAELATEVNLSSPAVKRRIDRLHERGVIIGYTAIVDHGKLGLPLQAFSELRFDGTAGVDEIASIANEIPEVEAVYTTAGDPDALALLRVRDVEDLKRVVDLIRRKGAGTKTLMVVGTSARTPA